MNRVFLLLLICLSFSCKTSYTGFNNVSLFGKASKQLVQNAMAALPQNESFAFDKPAPLLTASMINESIKAPNTQLFNLGETIKMSISAQSKTIEATVSKKVSIKEKLFTKILQKKLSKASTKPNQPDGFSNLDNKLKIGLILLLVALLLSAIGLHGLAGLAGLIGLVFLVLGLLNTYN